MKTKVLTLIIFSILKFSLFSQGLAKWGKLRNYETEMTVCAFDSTAEAVVLSDYENIFVSGYDPLTIEYHKRIKILKDNAKDRADIIISYYHNEGVDDITSIQFKPKLTNYLLPDVIQLLFFHFDYRSWMLDTIFAFFICWNIFLHHFNSN